MQRPKGILDEVAKVLRERFGDLKKSCRVYYGPAAWGGKELPFIIYFTFEQPNIKRRLSINIEFPNLAQTFDEKRWQIVSEAKEKYLLVVYKPDSPSSKESTLVRDKVLEAFCSHFEEYRRILNFVAIHSCDNEIGWWVKSPFCNGLEMTPESMANFCADTFNNLSAIPPFCEAKRDLP